MYINQIFKNLQKKKKNKNEIDNVELFRPHVLYHKRQKFICNALIMKRTLDQHVGFFFINVFKFDYDFAAIKKTATLVTGHLIRIVFFVRNSNKISKMTIFYMHYRNLTTPGRDK